MLNVALLDCAINENHCSKDWGRGIFPRFSSPSRGIWQLKCPSPQKFTIQGKQWIWRMHYAEVPLFFFAKCANFSAFSPILLHQNNQAITRPYKNNIWIRIRARRHFCSCLIICSTVTCILTCGMWPVKSPALSLLPKASQLNSIFLAIACTIDVILPVNIANVFQIWSTQAGYIRLEF